MYKNTQGLVSIMLKSKVPFQYLELHIQVCAYLVSMTPSLVAIFPSFALLEPYNSKHLKTIPCTLKVDTIDGYILLAGNSTQRMRLCDLASPSVSAK